MSPSGGGLDWRFAACGFLAVAFVVAGVFHVASPGGFLKITPGWVPWPEQVILATGLCEIAGGIALLIPRTRKLAGVMLAFYSVCVFPANINHALNNIAIGGTMLGWWYHAPRLALQPVIVWLCLWASGAIRPRRDPAPDRDRAAG